MPLPENDPIVRARAASADADTAGRAIPLLELASRGSESEDEIRRLCARGIEAGVAAICIHPTHLAIARAALEGTGVRLATVANFPAGGDDIAAAADEAAAAIADGAQEIDVVAPLAALLEGDIGLVGDLIGACRAVVTPEATLKLILETGRLGAAETIVAVARTAVMAGIDFLETSTGKVEPGATLEAAALLLAVVGEAEGRVGLKVSGGIRTADDAARYLALADAMMPAAWISPRRFRIGASGLLDDLQRCARG